MSQFQNVFKLLKKFDLELMLVRYVTFSLLENQSTQIVPLKTLQTRLTQNAEAGRNFTLKFELFHRKTPMKT